MGIFCSQMTQNCPILSNSRLRKLEEASRMEFGRFPIVDNLLGVNSGEKLRDCEKN